MGLWPSADAFRPRRTSNCATLPTKKRFFTDKNVHVLAIIVVINLSNILLVVAKGLVAYTTGSFSIANSTIESFGDVFVGALILITRVQAASCFVGKDKYPRGKTSESLCNVVASVVMLVLACVNGIISVDNFLADLFDPHLKLSHFIVISVNIAVKVGLFLLCRLCRDVDQVSVLAKDQITDVATNTATLLFALLTRLLSKYFDLIGALIIFIMIFWNWIPILVTNCNKIGGIQASKWREEAVEEIVAKYPDISTVTELIIYHTGELCIVEVEAECSNSGSDHLRADLCAEIDQLEWVRSAHVRVRPPGAGSPTTETELHEIEEEKGGEAEKKELLAEHVV